MKEPLPAIVAGMTNPSTVPNTSMVWTYAGLLPDADRRPYDIKSISINSISVPKRERALDPDKVVTIARSLQTEGLLQPIGVRKLPSRVASKFELVFGFHRLAAVEFLCKENPEQSHNIAAVIFPEAMPDWGCKLAEIAENLARKELTGQERESQTMLYAALLKKHGLVADADSKRSDNARNQYSKEGEATKLPHPEKPTLTQKLVSDLGVSRTAIKNQIERAKLIAKKAGLIISKDEQTLEKMSPDTLQAIGQKVAQVSKAERKEALKGAPDHLRGSQPDTLVETNIDVVDPKPFIDFCRRQIHGKRKPMSLDTLKAYRKALDELIAELEGK